MLTLLLLACQGQHIEKPDSTDTGGADTADSGGADSADTGDSADSGDTGDTALPIPEDNVANVLGDCEGHFGEPDEYPNQLIAGNELQRYTLHDPEAVCNDGSRAVMYVRAATNPELAKVWEIHLQGGGSCASWEECAARYCGTEYYDASKMSSHYAPVDIGATGIPDDGAANLLSGANHAFFYYCSSDGWGGRGNVTYTAADGTSPDYTMFEHGHTIVTAGIAELEAGVVADGGVEMPALTDASFVLFSGTSAGSAGARTHADWLADHLGANGTQVMAVFDAANDPTREVLPPDYQAAFDTLYANLWSSGLEGRDYDPWKDESCMDYFGGTGEEWKCNTDSYVIRNHVTTPFFLRQDLRDTTGLAEALGLPLDDYEVYTANSLLGLPSIGETSVETIDTPPGVYGPNCAQHVALESTDWWRVATVKEGGVPYTFQDAVVAWYQGGAVAVVDEPVVGDGDGPNSDCAAVDGER